MRTTSSAYAPHADDLIRICTACGRPHPHMHRMQKKNLQPKPLGSLRMTSCTMRESSYISVLLLLLLYMCVFPYYFMCVSLSTTRVPRSSAYAYAPHPHTHRMRMRSRILQRAMRVCVCVCVCVCVFPSYFMCVSSFYYTCEARSYVSSDYCVYALTTIQVIRRYHTLLQYVYEALSY